MSSSDVEAAITSRDVQSLKGLLVEAPNLADAPLIDAARIGATDTAMLLLDAGARVAVQGEYGETPLHWAAYNGNVDLVERLLKLGAATDVKDTRSNSTPLGWARYAMARDVRDGHDQVIAILASREGVALRSMGFGALAAVIISVPLMLTYGVQLDLGGAGRAIYMVFGIALFGALTAAFVALAVLLIPSWRRTAKITFAGAATALLVFIATIIVADDWRTDTFRVAADHAEPLIAAINAHIRDNGRAPATLQDLVPRYLPAIPDDLPGLEIVSDRTTPLFFDGNEWILRSDVRLTTANFDKFVYYPNQSYRAGSERIGKWAYVPDQ